MGRKMVTRVFPLALLCVFVLATAAFCGVAVTTGAGYKQMVEELGKAYRESGEPLEEMYGGPIGQVLVQIKQGSGANVVISDRGALEAASQGLEFGRIEPLGDTVRCPPSRRSSWARGRRAARGRSSRWCPPRRRR